MKTFSQLKAPNRMIYRAIALQTDCKMQKKKKEKSCASNNNCYLSNDIDTYEYFIHFFVTSTTGNVWQSMFSDLMRNCDELLSALLIWFQHNIHNMILTIDLKLPICLRAISAKWEEKMTLILIGTIIKWQNIC